jgi:hypothetical protein
VTVSPESYPPELLSVNAFRARDAVFGGKLLCYLLHFPPWRVILLDAIGQRCFTTKALVIVGKGLGPLPVRPPAGSKLADIMCSLSGFNLRSSCVYRSNSITRGVREIVLDSKDVGGFLMRSRIHTYGLAFIMLLTLGRIAFSTASPFAYGLIQGSCAPWDGPAIAITLTAEPAQCDRVKGQYISMGIWRGLPIHAGQTVKFDSGSDAGFGSRCAQEGDCQRAESGSIVFEKYEEGSGARGRYELHFKGGEKISGSFDVLWCKTRAICG